LRRKQFGALSAWLEGIDRKPLVIRGARQIGKSTLVRLFAAELQRTLAEVNLERHPQINVVFESMSPQQILNQLEALPNMPAIGPTALLFLDEIQAAPAAIAALRYFYEERRDIPVIAAGSLMEFALTQRRISIPVGRIQYLHMGPMTFTEYLEALGENKLRESIGSYTFGTDLGPVVHKRLLELLRSYYFVGGMPGAVDVYAKSRKLADVSNVHNSIIETYREDFQKYAASRNLVRMQHVLNFVARNVGTKIKYSNVLKDVHSATIRQDIDLLSMARVISKVVHTHASGLPLQADLDEKVYKLLFLDVGLMNAICGLGWHNLSKLDDIQLVNEGSIAEQFIGQHLLDLLAESPNRELTYWLREGRSSNAEIDFVVAFAGQIVPIEVKAGGRGSLRSVHQFVGEKHVPLAVRFDSNPASIQTVNTTIHSGTRAMEVNYRLLSLPLYLVEKLPDILRHVPT
jgi:predicted AAA+ superfamily ATPase